MAAEEQVSKERNKNIQTYREMINRTLGIAYRLPGIKHYQFCDDGVDTFLKTIIGSSIGVGLHYGMELLAGSNMKNLSLLEAGVLTIPIVTNVISGIRQYSYQVKKDLRLSSN